MTEANHFAQSQKCHAWAELATLSAEFKEKPRKVTFCAEESLFCSWLIAKPRLCRRGNRSVCIAHTLCERPSSSQLSRYVAKQIPCHHIGTIAAPEHCKKTRAQRVAEARPRDICIRPTVRQIGGIAGGGIRTWNYASCLRGDMVIPPSPGGGSKRCPMLDGRPATTSPNPNSSSVDS